MCTPKKVVPAQVRKGLAQLRQAQPRPGKTLLKEVAVFFTFEGSRVVRIVIDPRLEIVKYLVCSEGKSYWFFDHRESVAKKVCRMLRANNTYFQVIRDAVNGKDCLIQLNRRSDGTYYANLNHRKAGVKVTQSMTAAEAIASFYAAGQG